MKENGKIIYDMVKAHTHMLKLVLNIVEGGSEESEKDMASSFMQIINMLVFSKMIR